MAANDTTRLLAEHHVTNLPLAEQRAAMACALQLTDEEVARWLVVAQSTVRGQIGRAFTGYSMAWM